MSPGLLDGVNARLAAIEKRLDVLEGRVGGAAEAQRFSVAGMEKRISRLEHRGRRVGEKRR